MSIPRIRQVLLENGFIHERISILVARLDQIELFYKRDEDQLYFDVFGFRSMEDFKRVNREEFGVLIGCLNGPIIIKAL